MSHIHNLKIIDTGSGTSIGRIREIMGLDFVIHIAPPMEMMMQGVPRSEILDWLDKTVQKTRVVRFRLPTTLNRIMISGIVWLFMKNWKEGN